MFSSRKELLKQAELELSNIRIQANINPKVRVDEYWPTYLKKDIAKYRATEDYKDAWWNADIYRDDFENGELLTRYNNMFLNIILKYRITENDYKSGYRWFEAVDKKLTGFFLWDPPSLHQEPSTFKGRAKRNLDEKLQLLKESDHNLYRWYIKNVYNSDEYLYLYGLSYIDILDKILENGIVPSKANFREIAIRGIGSKGYINKQYRSRYRKSFGLGVVRIIAALLGYPVR